MKEVFCLEYVSRFLAECTPVLEDCALTRCWPEWGAEEHVPAFNRLYYILEGEGEVTLDGSVYRPCPGQLCLLPAGRRVSLRCISGRRCYKYWCHFRAEAYGTRLFDLIRAPVLLDVPEDTALRQSFCTLVEAFGQTGPGAVLRARARLLEILSLFFDLAGDALLPAAEGAGVPVEQLNALAAYIAEHLDEEFTLEGLAARLHFHPNYFIPFFKRYFGVSPLKYVSNLRIQKAKALLKNTPLSVAEVAGQTGYRDLFHFSKRFKEQTGYSPSDFRRL